MAALVIAEHDNATLKGSTLNTITAAAEAAATSMCWSPAPTAKRRCRSRRARSPAWPRCWLPTHRSLRRRLAENVAEQVLALASNYSHILAPATAYGKNILPRVAARLDVAQISEITKVVSPDTFERPIYAGNAIATVQSADPVKVITVRTTGFDAAAAGGSAAVENVTAAGDAGKSSLRLARSWPSPTVRN
jgi:electron transfer flavoprotein alpha subunit